MVSRETWDIFFSKLPSKPAILLPILLYFSMKVARNSLYTVKNVKGGNFGDVSEQLPHL